MLYAVRIKANAVLSRRIEHRLCRRVGHPVKKPEVSFACFEHRAKSWGRLAEWWRLSNGTPAVCSPRVRFIATTLTRHARNVVRFHNGCGTAEQWIRKSKFDLKGTRPPLPALRRQRGAAAALRPGPRPGELPASDGTTETG